MTEDYDIGEEEIVAAAMRATQDPRLYASYLQELHQRGNPDLIWTHHTNWLRDRKCALLKKLNWWLFVSHDEFRNTYESLLHSSPLMIKFRPHEIEEKIVSLYCKESLWDLDSEEYCDDFGAKKGESQSQQFSEHDIFQDEYRIENEMEISENNSGD